MAHNGCPYCGNTGTLSATTTVPRPADQVIVKCDTNGSCSGGYYMKRRWRSFPLDDRTTPDGDPISRVIDG